MEEMRSEIRAAFEKEQAGMAPAAALRRNLVEAVAARKRPAPSFQWVAVAAAVLLAVLVVAGLMSSRLIGRHANVTNPHPTPVGDYGPPPAGVALIYVHDPDHATWLIAYDWTGQPRGTVKLDQPQPAMEMAPDGQSFLSAPAAKGGFPQFFDRLGRPITSAGGARYTGGIWADDNRHFCSVGFDQNTFVWTLVKQLPGEAPVQVAVIAQDSGGGQTGIGIAACTVANDQAIVVRTSIAWPSELWVIKLSTGKVLSHHTYASESLASVVGSRDGLYIAETSSRSSALNSSNGAATTVYRRVSDWTMVYSRPATEGVLGFSGDGSLALVTTTPLIGGQQSNLAVIDLRTGQAIWHDQGDAPFGWFLAKPDGRDFALVFRTNGMRDPIGQIVIVHGDGSNTKLPRPYQSAW